MDLEGSADRLRRRWGITTNPSKPHRKTVAERVLAVIEHSVFLTVFSIVGGVLGVFFASWFVLILDGCILLAIHRSGSVADMRPRRRAVIFAAAFVLFGALFMKIAVEVRSNAKDVVRQLADAVAERVSRADSKTETEVKPIAVTIPSHEGVPSTAHPIPKGNKSDQNALTPCPDPLKWAQSPLGIGPPYLRLVTVQLGGARSFRLQTNADMEGLPEIDSTFSPNVGGSGPPMTTLFVSIARDAPSLSSKLRSQSRISVVCVNREREQQASSVTERASSDPYFLHQAYTDLQLAISEAGKSDKLVFVVIYDEQHSTMSKLAYSLGYFMEYQMTKRLVDTHFVTALIAASSNGAKRLVPEDDPLEHCLWVVLNSHGDILRREGLYANPDEGLKRTREVIAAYGEK